MGTSFEEKELYGELLSFLTVYLVDLSSRENAHLPHRELFSTQIKGHIIGVSGYSSRDWMAGLINQLGITKKQDETGFETVCFNAEDIKAKYTASPRPDVLTLEYMLEVFVDQCGGYGLGAIDYINCASKPIQTLVEYECLFELFVKYEYVKKTKQGYFWSDKIGPAMVRNSLWSVYSAAIQVELETETEQDRANRLKLMYKTMPKTIRSFIMNTDDIYTIAEKLRLNWNWINNTWDRESADLVTWTAYSEYVGKLKELVNSKI